MSDSVPLRPVNPPSARPTVPTKALKPPRPNPFAGYELRLGDLRVLYNVDEGGAEVVIVSVGRKLGNTLIIEGEEFHGRQDHSAE
jgi:hypothetical protein